MARSLRYVAAGRRRRVVPMAGPPCFLDDDLFGFNDLGDDPTNVFPDQTVYLEYMREQGADNGRLMIPGSVGDARARAARRSSTRARRRRAIFERQARATWRRSRRAMRPRIEAEKAALAARAGRHPRRAAASGSSRVLDLADRTAAAINGRVLLDLGDPQVVLDFWTRRVYAWEGDECEYRFWIDPALVEQLIARPRRGLGEPRCSSPAASRPSGAAPTTSTSTASSSASRPSGSSTPRAATPSSCPSASSSSAPATACSAAART